MYFLKQNPAALSLAQEEQIMRQMQPSHSCTPPSDWQSPIIFASPHSGSQYPADWLKVCKLSEQKMRQAEDAYVDQLFDAVPKHGAPLLWANFPRSYVDVNRAISELPQNWIGKGETVSPRAAAGLSVIPTSIGENIAIYNAPLDKSNSLNRLDLYRAYHATLQNLIDQAKARFGMAVLIDCHSMPGRSALSGRRPDFVLGDRYGKSCDSSLIDFVAAELKSQNYQVKRNYPYAGGYVTTHYGRPDLDVHVLQIEINRELYLNAAKLTKNHGYETLKSNLTQLCIKLIAHYKLSAKLAAE